MNRIYLSGPMRHWPNENFPAFHAATEKLRELGYIVFNPAETSLGKSFAEYMDIDLPEVQKCDIVLVLPDWECSRGAILEVMTGRALNKSVLELTPFLFGQSIAAPLCPAELASKACAESMRDGLGHGSGVWKTEPMAEHSLKASRHLLTAQLIASEMQPVDSEGPLIHARNAVCRGTMLLYQLSNQL